MVIPLLCLLIRFKPVVKCVEWKGTTGTIRTAHVGRCARTCILRYVEWQCFVRQQYQIISLYQKVLITSTGVAVECALVPELLRGRCTERAHVRAACWGCCPHIRNLSIIHGCVV